MQKKDWKKTRKIKIKEYLILSYIISLFLLGFLFIEYFFSLGYTFLWTPLFSVIILFLIVSFKFLKYKEIMNSPSKISYLIYIIFISLITILIYFNLTFDIYLIKIIYLVPIILATVNYGQKFGLYTAGFSSINIFILNFFINDFSNLDLDFIIIIIFFWIAWLIGGLIELERNIHKYLENLVVTDTLTGLGNYRHFQNIFNSWFKKAEENNASLSLAIMDLDNFKIFNDSLGHKKGDELLKELAKLLKSETNENMFLARYGGDEFALLLYNYNQRTAYKKITKIKRTVMQNLKIPFEPFFDDELSLSFGIASFPKQAQTRQNLFNKADQALYEAKSTQKNQVKIYHQALSELKSKINKSEEEKLNHIRTLLSIINAKDRYTYGHSKRTMNIAKEFADKLGLSLKQKKNIMFGAFLHDVGKIDINRQTLLKAKSLNEQEWDLMKKHPKVGAKILEPLNFSEKIIEMVQYHHENYDGTGYFEGLKEDDIPYFARVLRIIDSYDAMTTNRPYSPGLSKEEALEEIRLWSGKKYDPEVVETFLEIMNQKILV